MHLKAFLGSCSLAPSLVLHRIPADPVHRPRMNWDRRPQPVGLPTGTSDGPSARRAGGVGRRIRRGDVGPHRERGCALEHRASGARPVRKTRTLTTSAARPLSAVMSWNWAGEWALPPSNLTIQMPRRAPSRRTVVAHARVTPAELAAWNARRLRRASRCPSCCDRRCRGRRRGRRRRWRSSASAPDRWLALA